MHVEAALRVVYRGKRRRCRLWLQLHSATAAEEFECVAARDGGPSLGALRINYVCELLRQLSPASVCDVGCGEGRAGTAALVGGVSSQLEP